MKKYSTRDFENDFPTDDACLDWLLKARYPQGVNCPKCGKVTNHYRISGRPCYSCEICGSHVYPMAGTIFEDTKFNHLKLCASKSSQNIEPLDQLIMQSSSGVSSV